MCVLRPTDTRLDKLFMPTYQTEDKQKPRKHTRLISLSTHTYGPKNMKPALTLHEAFKQKQMSQADPGDY